MELPRRHPDFMNIAVFRVIKASFVRLKILPVIYFITLFLKKIFLDVFSRFPARNNFTQMFFIPKIIPDNRPGPEDRNFHHLIAMLPRKEMEEAELSGDAYDSLETFVLQGRVISHSKSKSAVKNKFFTGITAFGRKEKD